MARSTGHTRGRENTGKRHAVPRIRGHRRKHGLIIKAKTRIRTWGFSSGSVVKNLPANAGDPGSIPDQERSLSLCSRAQELQLLSPHATTTEALMP